MTIVTVGLLAIMAVGCGDDAGLTIDASFGFDAAIVPDAGPGLDAALPSDAAFPVDGGFSFPDGLPELACSPDEIQTITTCAFESCLADIEPGDPPDLTQIALCVGTGCFLEILSLSPECQGCVASALSGDTGTIADACANLDLMP